MDSFLAGAPRVLCRPGLPGAWGGRGRATQGLAGTSCPLFHQSLSALVLLDSPMHKKFYSQIFNLETSDTGVGKADIKARPPKGPNLPKPPIGSPGLVLPNI